MSTTNPDTIDSSSLQRVTGAGLPSSVKGLLKSHSILAPFEWWQGTKGFPAAAQSAILRQPRKSLGGQSVYERLQDIYAKHPFLNDFTPGPLKSWAHP